MTINNANFPQVSDFVSITRQIQAGHPIANAIICAIEETMKPGMNAAHPANFSNNIEKFFISSEGHQTAKRHLVKCYREDFNNYNA